MPDVALTADSLKKLKVPELKTELTKRGLSTAGKKEELLARLEEAVSQGTSVVAPAEVVPGTETAPASEAPPASVPTAVLDAPSNGSGKRQVIWSGTETASEPAPKPTVVDITKPPMLLEALEAEEKKKKRLERFKAELAEEAKAKLTEEDKRKIRAERFLPDEEVKRKQRMERFAEVSEDDKRKLRADKFKSLAVGDPNNVSTTAADDSKKRAADIGGLKALKAGDDDFELKKKARLDRFK